MKRRNFLVGALGVTTASPADVSDALGQLAAGAPEAPSGRQDPNPRAVLNIDPDAPTLRYSPKIFGGFLEHFDHQVYGGVFDPGSPLSDEKGFRRDVIEALEELRTPVVRWPVALCQLLGWEPYICNDAGDGTIQEMRGWVEYCNATKGKYAQLRRDNGYAEPRNVPIWSIGNENYHPTEIGYKPIEQWAPFVAEAARAMKAADSNIRLTAAAEATREWTLPLLQAAGSHLDYISIHDYWLRLWQKNEMPDYLACIMNSEGPEKNVQKFVGILDESGYRGKIKIAYDQWNLRGWINRASRAPRCRTTPTRRSSG